MSAADRVILEARDIRHTYGSGPTAYAALRGVDIAVARGEVLLLMGPSGSGKTTLLQVLGCLLTPSSGAVTLKGRSLAGLSAAELGRTRLAHIGFVFQSYNLFPTLTALENVAVALDLQDVPRATARQRAEALLDAVGLAGRAHAFPAQLSGGQRQRVAIARALAADPDVILADEPTAALDGESGARVVALLRKLADENGRAVVIVTHDSRITHVGDRIVSLEDGRVTDQQLASGPTLAMERP